MTLFLIAAAILVLVATTTLLWPMMRHTDPEPTVATSPALKVLREQRADLDAELAAGKISEAAHAQTLAEIEQRALDESAAPEQAVTTKARFGASIAVGTILPVAAIAIYLIIGNPAGLNPANLVAQKDHDITPEQIDAMVGRLAERVKANPDDIKGLEMLGRSYMVLNRFSEAAQAFEQLASKQPEDAQAYADWADAAAGAQDRKLSGQPEKLIAKALSLDPHNIKALALSGTLAFDRNDYKGAVAQWEKITALVPPDSEFGQSVQSMVAEARQRAGMPSASPALAQAAPADTPAVTSSGAESALKLKGRITIAAALKSQIGADDTLFIFARSMAGGPPIAGIRLKASDLPAEFDFAKAQMMMGTVGPQDKVIIGARVSKSGSPIAASGDLQGFAKPVLASADQSLNIEINEQVK